ncbi:Bestrophin, RFP-TM, chloride channel [compost metagenome]
MVKYDTKEWFSLIFKFHKSDTFRKLIPGMIFISIYTGLIAFIEINYTGYFFTSSSAIHSILGFVLSMLLVFRTNTAYDRWWEGRKAWGSLVNNSRNLAIKIDSMLPAEAPERKSIYILISNYVLSLKNHLRDTFEPRDFLPFESITEEELTAKMHKPNYIASHLLKKANEIRNENKISLEQYLVLNDELKSFTESCGVCERIKNTPIPYSYSLFLKKFIFIYIMTMPFGFIDDFGYGTILLIAFVFYVLVSLELIAEEIEDPFGGDANDLPTDQICSNIRKNVKEILAVE